MVGRRGYIHMGNSFEMNLFDILAAVVSSSVFAEKETHQIHHKYLENAYLVVYYT